MRERGQSASYLTKHCRTDTLSYAKASRLKHTRHETLSIFERLDTAYRARGRHDNIFIVLRNNIPSTNRPLRRPQVGFLDARTDFRASLFHVLQDRHAQLQAAQMALRSSSRPHHTIGTHSPRHRKPYVARC